MGLTQTQSILRAWKKAPAHHISTPDFHVIANLTQAGIGYGILPERFVRQEKLKLKQVYTSNYFKDEFSIIYRPEFGKNEVEKFLIQTLKSAF